MNYTDFTHHAHSEDLPPTKYRGKDTWQFLFLLFSLLSHFVSSAVTGIINLFVSVYTICWITAQREHINQIGRHSHQNKCGVQTIKRQLPLLSCKHRLMGRYPLGNVKIWTGMARWQGWSHKSYHISSPSIVLTLSNEEWSWEDRGTAQCCVCWSRISSA